MIARVQLPDELSGLTRTELERVIYESALHRDDEYIAREYLIAKRAQIDIAADLGWGRDTVSDHIKAILQTAIYISQKLKGA